MNIIQAQETNINTYSFACLCSLLRCILFRQWLCPENFRGRFFRKKAMSPKIIDCYYDNSTCYLYL